VASSSKLNSAAIALAKSAWESILFPHDNRSEPNAGLAKNAALRILAASEGPGKSWSGSDASRQREINELRAVEIECSLPKLYQLVGGGGEHLVFTANPPNGLFYKATWHERFGFVPAFDEFGNLELRPATPAEYLLRCGIANVVFGDDIRLHSIVPDQVGNSGIPSIVTSQPFVVGRPAEQEEITAYMQSLGFVCLQTLLDVDTGLHDVWYRPLDQVLVCDAVAGNFVYTEDGIVAAIDLPAAFLSWDEQE
jgi:hypothetical protein